MLQDLEARIAALLAREIPDNARELFETENGWETVGGEGWAMLGVRMGVLMLFVLGLGWLLRRFGEEEPPSV